MMIAGGCSGNASDGSAKLGWLQQIAVVDGDHGGGNVPRGLGAKKEDHSRDVTRIAQAAFTATRSLDRAPILTVSSTDSNIPMSRGIPAITMECGG